MYFQYLVVLKVEKCSFYVKFNEAKKKKNQESWKSKFRRKHGKCADMIDGKLSMTLGLIHATAAFNG